MTRVVLKAAYLPKEAVRLILLCVAFLICTTISLSSWAQMDASRSAMDGSGLWALEVYSPETSSLTPAVTDIMDSSVSADGFAGVESDVLEPPIRGDTQHYLEQIAILRRLNALSRDASALGHTDNELESEVASDALVSRPSPQSSQQPIPTKKVARTVVGLIVLFGLALLASHPRVDTFEREAGLSILAGTGIPFLGLGLVAGSPSIAILNPEVVRDLRPILEFGLGWIGFRIGTSFDVREMDRLPVGTGRLVAAQSVAAFLLTGAFCVGALGWQLGPVGIGFIRDGLILGACAAASAPSGARVIEAMGLWSDRTSRRVRRMIVLDDVVPIFALAVVTALYRPTSSRNWQLPVLGWVFLQVGMGAALGIITAILVSSAKSNAERAGLTLGAVAFASGMAGYIGFSPLSVGAAAGIVVTNVTSGARTDPFGQELKRLERPVYMAFFAIAGAMWNASDLRGWVLVPLWVIGRLVGKHVGSHAAYGGKSQGLPSAEAAAMPPLDLLEVALMPTGVVAIAVAISARQSYPDSVTDYLETSVIGGAVVCEAIFQFRLRSMRIQRGVSIPPVPVNFNSLTELEDVITPKETNPREESNGEKQ